MNALNDKFFTYYQRADLWAPEVVPPHGAVAEEVIKLIPPEAKSILDAGCGNGAISNAIKDRFLVGSDISAAALKYMQHPACVSDLGALPFGDASFDLVMVTDVLEHIPDDQYAQACAELERVARRWILVAVPYRELLDAATVQCANCDALYHVHWHQRVYDEATLARHWPGAAAPVEWRLAGDRWSWTSQPLLELAHAVAGRAYDFPHAVCPKCDTVRGVTPPAPAVLREFESLHYVLAEAGAAPPPPPSEVLVLYDKRAKRAAPFVGSQSRQSLPAEIVPRLLSHHKDPIAYPDAPYVTDVRADSFVLVLPQLPAGITAPAVEAALYDGVDGAYHPIALDGKELPGAAPTRFGYFVLVNAAWRDCPPLRLTTMGRPARLLPRGFSSDAEARVALARAEVADANAALEALEQKRDQAERNAQAVGKAVSAANERIAVLLRDLDAIETRRVEAERVADTLSASLERVEQARAAAEEAFASITSAHAALGDRHAALEVKHAAEAAANANAMASVVSERDETRRQLTLERYRADGFSARPTVRDVWRRIRPAFGELHDALFLKWGGLRSHDGPPRVLVVSHMYPRSYNRVSGIFVHEQVKALRAAGVAVEVLSGEPYWATTRYPIRFLAGVRAYLRAPLAHEEYEGVPVTYFPYLAGGWAPLSLQAESYRHGFSRALHALVHQGKEFSVVHAHTAYLDGTAARRAAARFGAPLLITEHTGPFDLLTQNPVKRRRTRAALRVADRVFAVSSALRSDMIRALGPVANRIEVLGNGVDINQFSVEGARSPEPHGGVRALWIGHHVPVKRIDRLINAYAKARADRPELQLSLLGDGELLDAAREQVARLGLGNSVAFLPATDRAGVATQIKAHDFVVISSEVETFGLVAVEAMACGRPVLATACGGPQDTVTSEAVGMIVENSEAGLASGLAAMAERLSSFDANQIRAHAERNHSWAHVASELIAAYQSAGKA